MNIDINFIIIFAFEIVIILLGIILFIHKKPWDRWPIYIILLFFSHFVMVVLESSILSNTFDLIKDREISVEIMLSTLLLVEASIFALILSIGLIVVQLAAASYSSRIVDIYRSSNDYKIIYFVHAVILVSQLSILTFLPKTNGIYEENLIRIAYFLGIFSIFSSIFYIFNILNLIKPLLIIERLSQFIDQKNILESEPGEDPIQPLEDIIKISLKNYDDATAIRGMKVLIHRLNYIRKDIGENDNIDFEGKKKIYICYLNHSKEIGSTGAKLKNYKIMANSMKILSILAKCIKDDVSIDVETRAKDRMMKQAINALYSIGFYLNIENFRQMANKTIFYLQQMAIISIRKDLVKSASQVVVYLENVSVTSVKNNEIEIAMKSVNILGNISGKLIKNTNFSGVAETTINSLKNIGIIAMEENRTDIAKEIIGCLIKILIEFAKDGREEIRPLESHHQSIDGQYRLLCAETVFYELQSLKNKRQETQLLMRFLESTLVDLGKISLMMSKAEITTFLVNNLELVGMDNIDTLKDDNVELILNVTIVILNILKAIEKEAKNPKYREIRKPVKRAIFDIEASIKS